jgi:hypothetical protein
MNIRHRNWNYRGAAAAALVLLAAAAGTSARASTTHHLETPTFAAFVGPAVSFDSDTNRPRLGRMAAIAWRGRSFAMSLGETVKVLVSPAYASDPGAARRWADFFASLVHGSELGLLTAYIAPLEEVHSICSPSALGCYWANRLVMVGDSSGGIPPSSVAAHEYGHHVAYNRINPPWLAVDWGTKRWASYMNICLRAAMGTAVPGDEDADYTLNPGEGFAEAYRVLNESQAGLPLTWPVVDRSFIPDEQALAALKEDVLNPWTASAGRVFNRQFRRGKRTWTIKVATPLDGALRLNLGVGAGGANALALLAENGRTVLGTGSWDSSGGLVLQRPVCGTRSTTVRVTRHSASRRFTLRVSVP